MDSNNLTGASNLARFEADLEDRNHTIRSLRSELDRAKASVEDGKEAQDSLERGLRASEAKVHETYILLAQSHDAHQHSDTHVVRLEHENGYLKERIKSLDQKNDELLDKLELGSVANLDKYSLGKRDELLVQTNNKVAELENRLRAAEAEKRSTKFEVATLRNEAKLNEESKKLLESSRQQLRELTAENHTLTRELNKFKGNHNEVLKLERKLEEARRTIQRQDLQESESKRVEGQLNYYKGENTGLKLWIEEMGKDLNEMDNLKADLDMRDKKIASLGKWNTDLKAEAENAEAQYKDLEKSNAVIQMQMQEANRDSKSLDDVNQAYERARMKLKDGEALRMEFSKDLNEKDVKIRKLEQDVRTLRHKVEHPDAVIIQNKSVADVTSQMGFDTITRMHGTREDKISSSLSTTADLAFKS